MIPNTFIPRYIHFVGASDHTYHIFLPEIPVVRLLACRYGENYTFLTLTLPHRTLKRVTAHALRARAVPDRL